MFSMRIIPCVLLITASLAFAQPPRPATPPAKLVQTFPAELVKAGEGLFVQHCAFCHGRDTGGGESGPDLTRSKLVATDIAGDKIGAVVRNGRPEKGMPSFKLSPQQVVDLSAFLHDQ